MVTFCPKIPGVTEAMVEINVSRSSTKDKKEVGNVHIKKFEVAVVAESVDLPVLCFKFSSISTFSMKFQNFILKPFQSFCHRIRIWFGCNHLQLYVSGAVQRFQLVKHSESGFFFNSSRIYIDDRIISKNRLRPGLDWFYNNFVCIRFIVLEEFPLFYLGNKIF